MAWVLLSGANAEGSSSCTDSCSACFVRFSRCLAAGATCNTSPWPGHGPIRVAAHTHTRRSHDQLTHSVKGKRSNPIRAGQRSPKRTDSPHSKEQSEWHIADMSREWADRMRERPAQRAWPQPSPSKHSGVALHGRQTRGRHDFAAALEEARKPRARARAGKWWSGGFCKFLKGGGGEGSFFFFLFSSFVCLHVY